MLDIIRTYVYNKIIKRNTKPIRKGYTKMTEQELQNAIKELSKLDNVTLEKALEKVHGTELSKARMMQLIEDYRYIEATMKKWFRQ